MPLAACLTRPPGVHLRAGAFHDSLSHAYLCLKRNQMPSCGEYNGGSDLMSPQYRDARLHEKGKPAMSLPSIRRIAPPCSMKGGARAARGADRRAGGRPGGTRARAARPGPGRRRAGRPCRGRHGVHRRRHGLEGCLERGQGRRHGRRLAPGATLRRALREDRDPQDERPQDLARLRGDRRRLHLLALRELDPHARRLWRQWTHPFRRRGPDRL